MPIAINDEVHENEFAYTAKQAGINIRPVQEETQEQPDVIQQGNQAESSTPSGTPVGSPTEPTGASVPQEGTGVAPQSQTTPAPSKGFTDAEGMVHPTPDYMNPPESSMSFRPSATGIITKTLKDAWEAFKAPGEAVQGKLPMWAVNPETGEVNTSLQAIEKAHNLASLMTTGPAPVASKMADGTLGSFMGVRSKTVDRNEIYRAQRMEMGGSHPDEIWRETGTFRGADGKWRQEISDAESSLKKENLDYKPSTADKAWESVGGDESIGIKRDLPYDLPKKISDIDWKKWDESLKPQKPVLLKDVLDHPELFKAYPEVGNIKVKNLNDYDPHGVSGLDLTNVGGIHQGDTIYMKNAHPDEFHSVLLHEIQHHIQELEDFAKGGNPGQFIPKKLAPAEKFFLEVQKNAEADISKKMGWNAKEMANTKSVIRGGLNEEVKDHPDVMRSLNRYKKEYPEDYKRLENIVRSEDLIKQANDKAYAEYHRLMGEVESRNVQARMRQSWIEQLNNSPMKTERQDVPRFMQKHSDDVAESSAVSASREVKPGELPQDYYDKVPQEMRLGRSGTEPSHPGYRWEVYDPTDGKTMRKDIMSRSGATRTQDNLDNKYGGYKYRVRMVKADKFTEAEQKFLEDKGIQLNAGGGMQYNFLGDMYNKITGNEDKPAEVKPAERLKNYPTESDAKYAIEQGFGYGSGNENYIEAKTAKLLGMTDKKGNFTAVPGTSIGLDNIFKGLADQNVDLTKLKNLGTREQVGTSMAQAALAVNRNPIAALGFDPSKIVMDIASGRHVTLAGVFDPTTDSLYASAHPELRSAIVHESIHRGLKELRKDDEAKKIISKLPPEESIVRMMMQEYAGNPERGAGGAADKQIDEANRQFTPESKKVLEQLMELAANKIKDRRPRGPK